MPATCSCCLSSMPDRIDAPSRSGTSAAATAPLKTASKMPAVWTPSNWAPYKSRQADFKRRSCRSSTDVAIPKSSVNGMRGRHEL